MFTTSLVKVKEKSSRDPNSGYGNPSPNPLAEQIKEAVLISNESAQIVVNFASMHMSKLWVINGVPLLENPVAPSETGGSGPFGCMFRLRLGSGSPKSWDLKVPFMQGKSPSGPKISAS